jgi:hypothetical protein
MRATFAICHLSLPTDDSGLQPRDAPVELSEPVCGYLFDRRRVVVYRPHGKSTLAECGFYAAQHRDAYFVFKNVLLQHMAVPFAHESAVEAECDNGKTS